MTILVMIIRKMIKNRWIVGSLLLGLVITTALVTTIPTYTSGILQRVLIKGLEESQEVNDRYPGGFMQYISFRNPAEQDKKEETLRQLEAYFFNDLEEMMPLPTLESVSILGSATMSSVREDGSGGQRVLTLHSLSDLEANIILVDGRMPSDEAVDGVYEVLLTENALIHLSQTMNMVLDTNVVMSHPNGEDEIKVKPVGTFRQKEESDLYWGASLSIYNDNFIVSDQLFRKELAGGQYQLLETARFYTAFDYYDLKTSDMDQVLQAQSAIRRYTVRSTNNEFSIDFPLVSTFGEYFQLESRLQLFLWSLYVPVLIVLGLYLFMVSKLIVERQTSEIAVLRSRGAGKWQVIFIYLIEVSILSAIAMIIGPYIGMLLSKILGSASGFLEFVDRTALPVTLSKEAYVYALITVLVSVAMVMIPVFLATRNTIVNHKQTTTRGKGPPLWQKFYLDVLLLGVTLYAWNVFQGRRNQWLDGQAEAMAINQVDPLLFFVPAIFVLGFGLLLLRIYPWLLKLIYWCGQKYWSPSFYAIFIQVGRSSKQYQFLMLFLMMTVAVGIYSASAARTMNSNLEEQIRYNNGAEITMELAWESTRPLTRSSHSHLPSNALGGNPKEQQQETNHLPERIYYSEPPFSPIQELAGVETATKVFKRGGLLVETNRSSSNDVLMMGIDPYDFGKTAWFKPSLLDHHWYHYLNLLSSDPSSILLSTNLAGRLGVEPGDHVMVSWQGVEAAPFVVFAFIDHWPSWNEHDPTSGGENGLLVANLPYVQTALGIEPYEVWLTLEEEVTSMAFYESLLDKDLKIVQLNDVRQEIIELKNSAFILGLNGALTLGFLISLSISFCGFLLYWVLTLGGRVVQYGVFRAMGLSFRQLISMMGVEQLLTSGAACLLGIVLGGITSRLFVPLFELSFDRVNQVPPFQVIIEASDEGKLYLFIILMLTIGLISLSWLMGRIRIHQAVKLGED